MSPVPNPENVDQGSLFSETIVGSGETDPLLYTTSVEFEPVPGGVFHDKTEEDTMPQTDPSVVHAVHKAVVSSHRHDAQLGKHSTLEREGKYADLDTGKSVIKAGDVLPGFGPVTYRNMAEAENHAYKLEQDRHNKR